MMFGESQILREESSIWYCVRTQPKHEHVAAVALRRNLGVKCFSPRIRYRKITRRGPVWFVEAMFPGYLFARFIYADLHRGVQSMPGVSSIVRFGDRVAALSEVTIDALRGASGEDEIVVFDAEPQVREPVKIAQGAFRGLEAVVTQVLPTKERVKVLLDFLGRAVEAEIRSLDVIPIASSRFGGFESSQVSP
jgi:transcriptional antiterminator RfaH